MAFLSLAARRRANVDHPMLKISTTFLMTSAPQILIGVGDMTGSPGCDPSLYSSASIAVDLGPNDTVRDVKKKLILAASWVDESPDDFGIFDDASDDPLKDAIAVEPLLSRAKHASATGTGRRTGGGNRGSARIRLPRPYVGVVWAART